MLQHALTPFLRDFLVRSRTGALIFCGTGVLVCGYFAVHCALALRAYPDEPASMTSSAAATAPSGWVRITDARFDCRRALSNIRPEVTAVPLQTTGAREIMFETTLPCDMATHVVEGTFEPMRPGRVSFFQSHGVMFRLGAEPWELSSTAGPSNEKTGMFVCSALCLASAVLYPLLQLARRRSLGGAA